MRERQLQKLCGGSYCAVFDVMCGGPLVVRFALDECLGDENFRFVLMAV
jgi:hypothetical protein